MDHVNKNPGRPRLDLSDEEKSARRRAQIAKSQEKYRQRKAAEQAQAVAELEARLAEASKAQVEQAVLDDTKEEMEMWKTRYMT